MKKYFLCYNYVNPAKIELYGQTFIEEAVEFIDVESESDVEAEKDKMISNIIILEREKWDKYRGTLINSPFFDWKPTEFRVISRMF